MVAWLALILSLLGLAWQVFTWRARRRPAALVMLQQSMRGPVQLEDPMSFGAYKPVVEVVVVNVGEAPFTVTQVGIAHTSGDPAVWQPADDKDPGRVLLTTGASLHREFDGPAVAKQV